MKRLGVRNHFRAVVQTVFPSLRVIGMAYAGLIGVGATALVVSVAFLPVAPVLQEATQPAREAVGTLVQPATDIVTNLIIGSGTVLRDPFFPFAPASQVALAHGHSLEENVPEAAAAGSANDQAVVAEAPPIQSTRALVASAILTRPVDDVAPPDATAEDAPLDEPAQAVDVTAQAPAQPVADAPRADSPVQQAANAEPARPLPSVPVPVPTEATWQTRARLDAENQAAIDAAKALVVDRKAQADAANQAAIDVRKAVSVNPVATPAPASPAAPQARAAIPVDNQSLIDTARADKLQARAAANAANQAAIDAAKAPRSVATATAQPAAPTATPSPAPTAEPTATNAPVVVVDKVLDSASLDLVEVQPSEQDEAPIMLAEDAPQD